MQQVVDGAAHALALRYLQAAPGSIATAAGPLDQVLRDGAVGVSDGRRHDGSVPWQRSSEQSKTCFPAIACVQCLRFSTLDSCSCDADSNTIMIVKQQLPTLQYIHASARCDY